MLTNLIKCGCCNTFSSFSPKVQLFKSLRLYSYQLNCWETAYFIFFFIFSFRNRVSFRYYGCGCWALRIWKIGNLRFPFWTAGTISLLAFPKCHGSPLPKRCPEYPLGPWEIRSGLKYVELTDSSPRDRKYLGVRKWCRLKIRRRKYVLGGKGISGAVTQGLRPVALKARRPISEHE